MKRILKTVLMLVLTVSVLSSMLLPASAAEVKLGIGVVNARGGLRLRSEASTSSNILATARFGDSVVLLSQHGDWYKVNYNLYIGYMHSDYLTVKDRANVDLGTGAIDGSVVNMRSEPTTASRIVKQLRRGDKVEIFGFNRGWYKVTTNNVIGYIRSDLIKLLEKPPANYGSAAGESVTTKTTGEKIATYARSYVGYPYVYGGSSPSGFDCSGFVQYVYKQFGITINRTATAQLANGKKVSRSELKQGDLVFFGYGNTATHVGIYIGENQFVHAQNSSTGVVITDLSVSYYDSRYLTARRIVE